MKERWLTEFKKDAQKLVTQYSIMLCHAECYLVNFEDEYICHKHDGGCEKVGQCMCIRENELKNNQ